MESRPERQTAAHKEHHRVNPVGPAVGKLEAVRVGMLGGFRVWVGRRVVGEERWRLRKARTLVKLLALSAGHRLHREQVMEALWPGLAPPAAANNLHHALHVARRALGPPSRSGAGAAAGAAGGGGGGGGVPPPGYLLLSEEQVALCPGSRLWVDVEAFEEAASSARQAGDPRAYRTAIDLYAGELLPEDRYEGWAEERRAGLKELHLSLLTELAALHEEHHEYEAAAEALQKAVTEEPTREEAHVGLMRLYALSGRRREALGQYERLEGVLGREFGTEPEASTRRLQREISSGTFPSSDPPVVDGFQTGEAAPGLTGAPTRHNLPPARTSFVGRERERLEVKRLLAMTKLLTLTGAGGSGKTRLALEAARDLVAGYPDGVWLAELAPLSDGTLVVQAVAQVLGVREQPGRTLLEALQDALRPKKALLLIDNCEHLVDEVARLVDSLLDACPHLKILATSRERLNTAGEVTHVVRPLAVPDSRRDAYTPRELAAYESVRLFVERAGQRDPSFELTPRNARAVAVVCRRLGGIPLAVELAAARMGVLSAEQLASRFEDTLGLLSSGERTAEPRQRSLRATLEWSHELLGEPERVLFGRLSVFAGGWTLEAAEEVCSGEPIEEAEVLDLLSELADKSLVVAEPGGGASARMGMLEPIRHDARERLERGGQGESFRRRHARFFLALAEEAEPRLWGPDDAVWIEHLEAEHDNLRTALSWSLECAEPEVGLRLARALWRFWDARGYYDEGRRWCERTLGRGERARPARARVLAVLGYLAHRQGDLDRVENVAEEGLELGKDLEDEGVVAADFSLLLGGAENARGQTERAEEAFERALALGWGAGDERVVAWALNSLGNVLSFRGEHERAKELYEESLALSRKLGGADTLSANLLNLGYELLLEGHLERAVALNEEAATLLRNRGYRGGLQYALDNLGWAALLRGDHERARELHEESLRLCRELRDRTWTVESLEGLACAAAATGEAGRAAELFGAAWGLLEELGYRQEPRQRALREPYLAAARSRLGLTQWERKLARGRTMPPEEAIEHALSDRGEESATTKFVGRKEQRPPHAAERAVTLTAREREVALLVARGLTNRRVADELSISERTVENHVARILKKLGLRSRVQIAAWMAQG